MSRDFNSNYMRAVEVVGDDEHFVGADDNGNLFVVRLSRLVCLCIVVHSFMTVDSDLFVVF